MQKVVRAMIMMMTMSVIMSVMVVDVAVAQETITIVNYFSGGKNQKEKK